MREAYAEVLARFQKDIASHELDVIQDSGVYRHLRFRRPGTASYGFDIVTWPGHLAISGDMGCSVFSRLNDMFEFFRSSTEEISRAPGGLPINVGYWAEKCVANDGVMKEFREEYFRSLVKERFDSYVEDRADDDQDRPEWAEQLWDELESMLSAVNDFPTVDEAIRKMDDFESDLDQCSDFRFVDAWEDSNALQEYRFHFIWRLFAIAYAIQAYDHAREMIVQGGPNG